MPGVMPTLPDDPHWTQVRAIAAIARKRHDQLDAQLDDALHEDRDDTQGDLAQDTPDEMGG
jgi:hypothetical protein